jgi:hypothetical protein
MVNFLEIYNAKQIIVLFALQKMQFISAAIDITHKKIPH